MHQKFINHLNLFFLIIGDIWGPSRIQNITREHWFLLLIDDHTQVSWTFLMKDKSETNHIFQAFHKMIQNQFQANVQVSKTDNARDFFYYVLGPYLESNGIVHQSSCVDTPQQNSVAEHKNFHFLKVARSLLFTSHVPKRLWSDAILTTTYLINSMPSRVLKFKTQMQTLLETFPHSHLVSQIPLKIIGCIVFVHAHSPNQSKLEARATKCILIGYTSNKKGYKCYYPIAKKIFNSMAVTFFED